MASGLLELQAIRKYFPIKKGLLRQTSGAVRAVDGVSLEVKKGENLGLVGESGSGKTTLGKLIMKLLETDKGRIIFQGQDITCLSDKELRGIRRKMQIVFQDPFASLDPRFNVERIIAEGMVGDIQKTRQERRERVEQLLGLVGLSAGMAGRFPHEFSGGERQRIAIARALASQPQFLVLDEAVSSLDVLAQAQILRLLLDLQQKFDLTYLFISHNLRVIRKVCQRVAVMYQGKIVEAGTSREIFEHALHPYTQELLSAALDFKTGGRDKNDFFTEDKSGCCYNRTCLHRHDACSGQEPELKEVSPGHLVSCHFTIENRKRL
jgi:oligopeptide/dipeptide ABC transporter ATP-binding protein